MNFWYFSEGTQDQPHPRESYTEGDTGAFPGGLVIKNPPASAGDMGSIPGPGRSHMARNNHSWAWAP